MIKPVFALVLALVAAEPVAAIQTVQLVPETSTIADCPANTGARNCAPQPATSTVKTATALGNGSLVAGLAGLLVLGLVFGRRKAGLPEVVS